MRIVIAHESVDTAGGVETYLASVMPELRRRGHQMALLYHRRRQESEGSGNDPGSRGTRRGSSSGLRHAAQHAVGVEESGLDAAIDKIGAWRPDVCYSHNMGPLEVDKRLLGRWPVVKMVHGYFGTCVSGLKTHAFPSMQACGRTLGPPCLLLYVPRRCGPLTASAMVHGYRWACDQRAMLSHYRSIVVASRHMGEEVGRHTSAAGRIEVVPLFSTIAPSAPTASAEPDTVLFAGRMTPLKGGHVLIAAAARAARLLGRPVRLIMAGDGPRKESWRELASSLRVPTEFTGWVDIDDRPRVYGRATLMAVPSLWPEPFGLVGLEAGHLGLPSVAFDVGGIREWLRHGSNGLLVAPADGDQGLGRAIAAVLNSPAERERMGREAFDLSQEMSLAAHVDRLESILLGAAAS
jgi:glycosyltransferase involved in cell wall biosynthesis